MRRDSSTVRAGVADPNGLTALAAEGRPRPFESLRLKISRFGLPVFVRLDFDRIDGGC